MKCPKCDIPFLIDYKNNVEIDYCNQCQGVWLDQGELEKILAMARQKHAVKEQPSSQGFYRDIPPQQVHQTSHQPLKSTVTYHSSKSQKKAAKSILDSVFDLLDILE